MSTPTPDRPPGPMPPNGTAGNPTSSTTTK